MTKLKKAVDGSAPKKTSFVKASDWPEYVLLGLGVLVAGVIVVDTARSPESIRQRQAAIRPLEQGQGQLKRASISGGTGFPDLATKHLELLSEGQQRKAQDQYCAKGHELQLSTVNSFNLVLQSGIDEAQGFVYAVDTPDLDKEEVVIEVWKSNAFFDYAVASKRLLNHARKSDQPLGKEGGKLGAAAPRRNQYSDNDFCIHIPPDQLKG